jgi:16S rRNA (cytosine1402-N4)-methyltransferase
VREYTWKVSEELIHKPVLLAEVLQALQPHSGGRYIDATLGGLGHARAILEASHPDGLLFGCDWDPEVVQRAATELVQFAGRFEVRHSDFADLATWIPPASCEGALFDLGISSLQLDRADRGFTFQQDGPLDMRLNRDEPGTAADLLNELSEAELAKIFWEYGQERESRRFARAIIRARQVRRLETTRQLAELIERLSPRRGQARHPATQVFQAVRIAVNHEWKSLKSGLAAALSRLKRGGRIAVITFHSGEDRIVKEFGRAKSRDYSFEGDVDDPALRRPAIPELKWVNRKAIHPSAAEVQANPRARSAQLRIMEKL